MIVAIIDQTAPVGQVQVNTFLNAVDEAAAVTAYVNSFNPALDPADWLGYEPELSPGVPWPAWQSPGTNANWFYDFAAPGLVAVAGPPTEIIDGGYTLVSDEFVITSDAAWENIGGVVFDPSAYGDVAAMMMRACGEFTSDATGGTPQLRLVEDANVIATANMPTQPAFTFASFNSIVGAPTDGMHLYMLQGRLNGGVAATLRAGILQIVSQS